MAVRLVVPGAGGEPRPDPSLMRLLVRAFAIRDRLDHNSDLSIQRIAEAEGVVASYATRLLRLSFLAPGIVAAILEGRQPVVGKFQIIGFIARRGAFYVLRSRRIITLKFGYLRLAYVSK